MTPAAAAIRTAADGFTPATGLILGSGLNVLADAIELIAAFDFSDLEGVPIVTAPSHRGRLTLGHLAGHPVACLQCRIHLYEGVVPADLAILPCLLKEIGCNRLIVTNAAGSLDPAMPSGAVMAITDHINLMGDNPLAAPTTKPTAPVSSP